MINKEPEKLDKDGNCPKCGAPESERVVIPYGITGMLADVHCRRCNQFIRSWDAY